MPKSDIAIALAIVSAWPMASIEMTCRPVTTGGQVLFGIGCGAGAMLLQLYTTVSVPCYMAVLAMNTFTPTIDRIWRARVFGTPRFGLRRRTS